ncbi:MAG: hypothetical protein K2X11_16040 [Acetobacteraceae bacterium]|nr:hypothetical protein [Acetobacteraceae bacterium]
MRRIVLVLALMAGPAWAQGGSQGGDAPRQPTPAQQAQQERMRSCNATATAQGLTGDRRQEFMRDCLRSTSRN